MTCRFMFFSHISTGQFVFFLTIYESSYMDSRDDLWVINIFSLMACLFHFVYGGFCHTGLLILLWYNLSAFFLCDFCSFCLV